MKKHNYAKLIISRLLDQIGNVTYDYANSVWIASMGIIGHKYLGIYQTSEAIISIIFNPIAGVIADRTNRKKNLISDRFYQCPYLYFGFVNRKQSSIALLYNHS